METVLLGLKLYIGYVIGSFIVGLLAIGVIVGGFALLSYLNKPKKRK